MKHREWKTALLTSREAYMLEHYAACRDFGVPAKKYSDKTANGLTTCIIDFLKYNGHYANRINTTGMLRKINGQMKWTKSGTRKGTADIDAIIAGKPVKIEIKVGRDKISDHQRAEQKRVEAAGGVYLVIKNMDEFYEWHCGYVVELSTS